MEYLEKVCCFFIFARIFLHMCPSEKYEAYLSALISWVAFCIVLSPLLSGEAFAESYRAWEEEWDVRVEMSAERRSEQIQTAGEQAATEILEEFYDEQGSDQ